LRDKCYLAVQQGPRQVLPCGSAGVSWCMFWETLIWSEGVKTIVNGPLAPEEPPTCPRWASAPPTGGGNSFSLCSVKFWFPDGVLTELHCTCTSHSWLTTAPLLAAQAGLVAITTIIAAASRTASFLLNTSCVLLPKRSVTRRSPPRCTKRIHNRNRR